MNKFKEYLWISISTIQTIQPKKGPHILHLIYAWHMADLWAPKKKSPASIFYWAPHMFQENKGRVWEILLQNSSLLISKNFQHKSHTLACTKQWQRHWAWKCVDKSRLQTKLKRRSSSKVTPKTRSRRLRATHHKVHTHTHSPLKEWLVFTQLHDHRS